jgi:hypothetical protein
MINPRKTFKNREIKSSLTILFASIILTAFMSLQILTSSTPFTQKIERAPLPKATPSKKVTLPPPGIRDRDWRKIDPSDNFTVPRRVDWESRMG